MGDFLARLDVLYFDETEKAKMFIDIWFQTLNELEPNVKELLLHDIKLTLQTTMSKRIIVHHKHTKIVFLSLEKGMIGLFWKVTFSVL